MVVFRNHIKKEEEVKKIRLLFVGAIAVIMVLVYLGIAAAGDLVEVVSDKEVYSTTDPIVVMAKFTNFDNISQLIKPPAPGGLDVRVYIRAEPIITIVGGLITFSPQPVVYSGTMNLANPATSGVVEASSSVIATYLKIPAGKLKPGIYVVDVVFNISSATNPPQVVFKARPNKLIRVK